MKRRIISMLLVLAMVVSLIPQWIVGAAAEGPVTNGETAYDSISEAVAAVAIGDTLKLHADLTEDVTVDKDLYLDLNGFDLGGTLTVSEGATVYGLDSQTDDFTVADAHGYGSITAYTGDLLADSGYAMIQGESGYSFHHVDMQITDMTLRAEDAAVYYKSYFAGDEVFAANVDTYGIAMSIAGIPNAENVASCPASKYDDFESGVANSTLLYNIINSENPLEENIYRAELDVYARAYVRMADGQYILGEHAQRSLRDQVEEADYIWGELTDEQRTALREMYGQFSDVMTEWTIPNIAGQETPGVELPAENGAEISIVDAIAAGDAMSQDTFTTNKYKITGVIDEIYNTTYGNMYIKDAEGNRLKIYGTYDATGNIRYDAMTVKPAVGDTVVLLGVVGNYNGAQMKDGWIVEHTPGEGTDTPGTPDEPETTVSYVDAPVAGTAYKFVMNQAGLGKKLGFTGKMGNTYYFGTSEDVAEMVDVYLEEATGGYHIYFMNGETKTYLNVIPRANDATKTNVVMQTIGENAAPSVYELNTEFKYVKTACVGTDWYLGTYGSNTTISASKTSYIEDTSTIGVSQFVTWFATAGTTETPDTPDAPTTVTIAEALAATTGDFTVKGVITMIDNSNVYLQDSTGAICAYMSLPPEGIALGDTIVVTGGRMDYNGLPELSNATFEKSSGLILSPKDATLAQLTTADICTYVKLTGLEVTSVTVGTSGKPDIMLKDAAGNTIKFYKAVVEGSVNVGDKLDVTGSIGIFNTNLQLRNTLASEVVITAGTPSTPETPETPETPSSAYTMIDKVADLTAGTYKMAAYLTVDSNKADLSAAPYHLWDGTVNYGDLVTNSYAFADGNLTAAGTDASADIKVVAVAGKENTYYIMVGEKYLYSTESATNRKLELGDTPTEWLATDNSNGGITLSSNSVYLGSANAASKFLRSYKGESTLKYGVVFFVEN